MINVWAHFFHIVEKYDFRDKEGHPIRNCQEIIDLFEAIAPKRKKQYIDTKGILDIMQNPTLRPDIKFIVNKEDYEILAQKEGQSYIWEDNQIKYIIGLKDKLVKTPGIKKSYIITPSF